MTVKYDFTHQVVLVTGASRGIGREIAKQFAEAGANVIVHYNRNQAGAEETLESLSGGGHIVLQAEFSNTADLQKLSEEAIAHRGQVDILVNNAAVYATSPIADCTLEEWRTAWQSVIQTNLIGTSEITYLIAQHMIAQGHGRIVNVSSRGAYRGEPTAPAYGASKAAINSMGQSLAQALAPHNVFVHSVAPGFVETESNEIKLAGERGVAIRSQSPLNRVALPHEVARTVLFCAAKGTEFLTGGVIDVNGASHLR